MTITYNNQKQMQNMKSMGDMTTLDPNKLTEEGQDRVAWAMAQGQALSKVKLFTSMAKSINDQQ
jgi:hypothetical protein